MVEAAAALLKKLRVTPDGKATFAVIQAEDELAAIGMVLGAGWAGARSMTATSGPGMSLMAEFCGLGYYAEIPGVIINVQRTGPSTGMPTRTQQADLLSAAFLSHGDTKHILLLPGSVKECYELTMAAFDLAERFQTPVFVLSDTDMGMNHWMSEPFDYPTKPLDRGKVLTAADLERLGGFERYRDVDGDAIGWRTLPGTKHPKASYFTRGSGHNAAAGYTENPVEYQAVMDRLARKFDNARKLGSRTGRGQGRNLEDRLPGLWHDRLRSWRELRPDQAALRKRCGLSAPSGLSVYAEVHDFVASHERIYVVEQNRDAQLACLLKLDLSPADGEAAQHSALQRIAAGRADGHGRVRYEGGPVNGYSTSSTQVKSHRPSDS